MRFGALVLVPAAALAAAAPAFASTQDNRAAEANAAFVVYPKASLDAGEQGTVRYRVKIDRRGRARECAVLESSGFQRLDMATCALLMDKAQFTPGSGRRGSTYEGRVRWQLS
jgi:TonB family protein